MNRKSYRRAELELLQSLLPKGSDLEKAALCTDEGVCPTCHISLTRKGGCYNCEVETYFPKNFQ